MDMTSGEVFSASVEIPYQMRFLPLALDWGVTVVKLAGGNTEEANSLRLAMEETLAFLISAYPDAEDWELIRCGFLLRLNGAAEFAVTNSGPPVHPDRIPDYDPLQPGDSELDGLWFFLAREAVDDLVFENHGMQGWCARMTKKLAAPYEKFDKTPLPAANRKNTFSTRLATPDDAAQLMDLTYDTYRYSYPGEEFYHSSRLRQAIASGGLVCTLVEADNVIVGSSSISFSPDTPQCAYMGALMVRRAFRNSRAIMLIIQENTGYMKENRLNMEVYYGTMVTAHPASQKAGAKVGLKPLALLLAVGLAVDYRNMKTGETERESFLLCPYLTDPSKAAATLYLPRRHHEVMQPLLAQLGCTTAFSEDENPMVVQDTVMKVSEDFQEKTASVIFEIFGMDWVTKLRKQIFHLHAGGIQTVIVMIPAWTPLPPGLDRHMNQLNGIFSGLKPVSNARFYNVYSVISNLIDFEDICLADPLALDLMDHMRNMYREIFI